MTVIKSNGIDIAFEEHGSAGDPAVLMVQGLGMPLSGWPPAMLEALVGKGFHVIAMDNRDIGRSQLLSELDVPNIAWQTMRRKLGLAVRSPYQLTDMMQDAQGLLDALNIYGAHVVGVSMGGMISQLLAIHHPARVKSLTSIMSTTGNPKLPGPTREVRRHIMRGPAAATDEARLEYHQRLWRLIGSPEYPLPEQELSAFLQRVFECGMTRGGVARQMLAIMAAHDRAAELHRLQTPSLVIHGEADPLVPVECGHDTAGAIPGSRIVTIPGMGHDLPEALVPRLTSLIGDHAWAAERPGELRQSVTG